MKTRIKLGRRPACRTAGRFSQIHADNIIIHNSKNPDNLRLSAGGGLTCPLMPEHSDGRRVRVQKGNSYPRIRGAERLGSDKPHH
jgi:hypothetical protein